MELSFRLFNCDRTFSLDKVQALITKVSPEAKIKQQYFGLPQMSELCNELKEEGAFSGYAVFVVHAHESRLSLNEENAGIGYAKLYRTLLKITDGRVLIVIGGDNSYKANEQEDAFLSQWAWRKICSQFTEDFMDGTKSFIFSWEGNHRPIHEEALAFYLNPNKTQQKFVPKPKPKPPTTRAASYDPKGAPRDALKPFGQQPYTPQGQKPPLLNTKPEEFSPKKNKGRVLPTRPPTQPEFPDVKKDVIRPPQPQEILMDIDEPPSSKSVPPGTYPMVHVVSMLSDREDVLQNPVLSLFASAFQSLDIPTAPYIPDVKRECLPQLVKDTSPDFVVLASEYEEFDDLVENLKAQTQLLKALLTSVSNEKRTKIIFVLTGDNQSTKDDLSSKIVDCKVQKLNGGILKHDKLTILSWNNSPSTIHQDAITMLLRGCKSAERQPKTMRQFIVTELDAEKGCLRYRAFIQDGRVLAVLKSDPYGWSPDRQSLSEPLAKHRERTEVEVWENSNGAIIISVPNATRMLRKMVDVGPTQRRRSLQVYSYHSDEETVSTVISFIKGLGIDFIDPLKNPVEVTGLFQNIAAKKPEYIAFSSDIKVFQDFQSVQELVKSNWLSVRDIIANLKGIIIMVIGDQDCQDGHLVSENVLKAVRQLTAGIEINQEKITVMSWRTRPFIRHQEKMKSLLQIFHEPTQGTPTYPRDPTRGFLRFKAELINGLVEQVSVCIPPSWKPDPRDLEFLFERYKNEPKATLEFWADSLEGPTKPPVVKTEQKSRFSMPSMPSLPSFSFGFKRGSSEKDDIV